MWYPATVTTPPATEPVTLDDVKRQVYVDHDDDNDLIERLIAAARDHVERYCGAMFASQTVTIKCDEFGDFSYLPVAPVSSISSIEYDAIGGTAVTLPTSVYELRSDGIESRIVLKYGQQWPPIQPGSRITVTAVVGHDDVPPAVKHAMLLYIANAFENRENAADGGWTTMDSLLCNFRRG
ncbi:head-tail connector protein [Consotaella salsifontis]|uniref:Phage gp6-like head-tail connector protein n=1 Tax=Consotaella salsifontis TaxID=1365950 RepID=A0A1T4SS23_9HYPH|nr:head-tail connector protein [Consotaella salsifontis]SKA31035.1 uncharacterized phage protein (possible DNA packaging)/phage conserved hypothetical protein, phiE125 gp8 family [Consotaella salsifontis]